MFKRILVPLDGSTRAERALPVAARLARAAGGSVVLVQVASVPITYSPYLASSAYAGEVIEEELTDAENYLKTIARSEVLAGIEVETKVLFGAAAQTVLSIASSYQVDLIVMTSHGRTGMKRWVLGSVAQKLARYSSIPVFVLHAEGPFPAGPHPDAQPIRALVTLDGSFLAKAALEPAAQLLAALAAPAQGALHLMRVVKPPTLEDERLESDQEYMAHLRESTLHKAKIYLDSVAGHLREGPLASLNLSISWSVVMDDDVAHAIISTAENGEGVGGTGAFGRFDLIAMATHGRGGLHHWVLGSVTERVLGSTKLPILIVRPHEADFKQASSDGEISEAYHRVQVKLPLS